MSQSLVADRDLAGIPVRVHYPASFDGVPAPVVLFSHGFGGSRLGYQYLGRALSARGYVAIHPSHRDPPAVAEAMANPEVWARRPRDLAFVLDRLAALESLVPALAGRLDTNRIAIGGHSFGAFAALICAGAAVDGLPAQPSLAEPRARAFFALSPPGNGSRGLSPGSWATVQRPVLAMTGTLDAGPHGQPYEWRLEPFRQLAPGGKTLVVLAGADHESFAGGLPRRRADPALLASVERAVAWFCDRHLRGRDEELPPDSDADVEQR